MALQTPRVRIQGRNPFDLVVVIRGGFLEEGTWKILLQMLSFFSSSRTNLLGWEGFPSLKSSLGNLGISECVFVFQ